VAVSYQYQVEIFSHIFSEQSTAHKTTDCINCWHKKLPPVSGGSFLCLRTALSASKYKPEIDKVFFQGSGILAVMINFAAKRERAY
jgi:hypothetical protein